MNLVLVYLFSYLFSTQSDSEELKEAEKAKTKKKDIEVHRSLQSDDLLSQEILNSL